MMLFRCTVWALKLITGSSGEKQLERFNEQPSDDKMPDHHWNTFLFSPESNPWENDLAIVRMIWMIKRSTRSAHPYDHFKTLKMGLRKGWVELG